MNSEKPLHCLLWCWKFKRMMNKSPCLPLGPWFLIQYRDTKRVMQHFIVLFALFYLYTEVCKPWVMSLSCSILFSDVVQTSSWKVNMEILMGCTALLADPWEWLQRWGLKRVPWVGVEGSAPAQVDVQVLVLGLHEALEGSAWQRTALACCGRKVEEIISNDPKQVHGHAKHTEELWWLVTTNIKSTWGFGFCSISVESGIIQVVPVVLPGRRDCCSQSTQPNN